MRLRRQTLEERAVSDLILHCVDKVGDYSPALDRYIGDRENQLA